MTAGGVAIAAVVAVAGGYQLFALAAVLRHLFARSAPEPSTRPPVSILKPIRGLDAGFLEAIRSHATQEYAPGFEILFGVRDPADPAVPEIERLIREFPGVPIRLLHCSTDAPNGKVGVLMDLAKEARYPVWIVSDGDISVPQGYLASVTAPLAEPPVGVVTCLYRAEASDLPGRFEALGVVTDFAPSALVAPLVGVSEFGFGSTLAFRRDDLLAIGGFEAISGYVADDYHLGAKIHALGRRNVISQTVVGASLHAAGWRDVWKHQVRWARTIRVSRPAGYAGLPVTHASFWALIAAVTGHFFLAGALLCVRLALALVSGWVLLRSPDALRWIWLTPLRDLYAVAVWAAGLAGKKVLWRGRMLTLDPRGRIIQESPSN
ncbi:MAG TPA: bacteriohopanetetrol glucosamine biosynthesis glycosyltransferase HpnI [Bryobacteraceae bacterium]|nr:bacteriohopanetetrol glucosamine biosynthesis glycosyltransferase HpnI [Bryobacteraceae bacterium]